MPQSRAGQSIRSPPARKIGRSIPSNRKYRVGSITPTTRLLQSTAREPPFGLPSAQLGGLFESRRYRGFAAATKAIAQAVELCTRKPNGGWESRRGNRIGEQGIPASHDDCDTVRKLARASSRESIETGLTRCKSKPAAVLRRRSSSWPYPVTAISICALRDECARSRVASS